MASITIHLYEGQLRGLDSGTVVELEGGQQLGCWLCGFDEAEERLAGDYPDATIERHEIERHNVIAAQLICAYRGPQWLVEPVGDPSGESDLATICEDGCTVLDANIRGWGEYNAIISTRRGQAHYLARIED